jgi:transposase
MKFDFPSDFKLDVPAIARGEAIPPHILADCAEREAHAEEAERHEQLLAEIAAHTKALEELRRVAAAAEKQAELAEKESKTSLVFSLISIAISLVSLAISFAAL